MKNQPYTFGRFLLLILLSVSFYSCATTEPAVRTEPAAPEETREPVDFSTLLEPPKDWHHLDEEQTQFRGISSGLAYNTLLAGKTPGREIVVAVIDGGVDADHEDLKEVMWINEDEIPDNGKDDDENGYVDDVHGWNFIGGPDGKSVNHDTFELTRIYRRLSERFSATDTTVLNEKQREEYKYYQEISEAYREKVEELLSQYNNVTSLEESMAQAEDILADYYNGQGYTYEDLQDLQPQSQQQQFAQNVMLYVMENDIDSTLIADQKKQVYEFAKYGYNPDFSPRNIVGDNYEDKSERHYGNNDVAGPDPSHGTHVAGIVAAMRNNDIGIDGVATGTRIMAVRAVPNGDERDKDVANAIRYAADNGAHVINMSFGKGYSPYKEVVDEAIKYAEQKGVLMVHGAGNDASNTDEKPSFPTDKLEDGMEAQLWLTVGASNWKPGEEFVANFSNYGKKSVDLFAPGVDIYSTMPDNEYKFQDGTSMASPVVAGVAALVMAYYQELSVQQVRQLIVENTVDYSDQQVTQPNQQNTNEQKVPFGELSVTGGLVNVHKILEAAENF